MKTNKYLNSLVGGALLTLGMGSCASDYLDTPNYGNIDAATVCETTETAHQALLGACSGLSHYWSYSLFYQMLGMGECAVGTFYGEWPGSDWYNNYWLDNAPSWQIYFTMDDTMGKGNYVWDNKLWNYAYAMIGQVNEIIDGIDDAEGDEAERNFVKGASLALRAHCYWRLLEGYAPRWDASDNGTKLCVVLRTSPSQDQNLPLSTMGEVLDQCYADLDQAIECFTAAGSYSRTQYYEPDLNVCYGIYARVASLKNDWQTVKTMAHNARQGKRLATTAEAFNGYNQYNSGEWMWSGSFSDMDNYVYSNWSTCYGANGYYARTLSATSRIDRKLYEQIPETDVRRDLWFTYDKLDGIDPEDFYVAKNVNSQNLDITFRKGRRAAVAWLEDHNAPGFEGAYSASTDDSSAASPCICDGAQLKFFSGGLIGQDSFGFPPFMRATEMYLLEAEACAMLGQSSEAQAILNEVNQPRNPQYNCTLTGQSLIDEVRLYTRIELWGEGFCWFNLKRWGLPLVRESWKAGDVTSGNLPSIVECNVSPDAANLWRYGVPLSETNYNDQVTYPYPGNGLD